MKFYTASEEDVLTGKTTDIYFLRAKQVLEERGVSPQVIAEFTAASLPGDWRWGVFAGLEETLKLLEGKKINLYALPEGSIFTPYTADGVRLPVMYIEGRYTEFALYETPALGLICHASGIATTSALCRRAAGDALLISFGVRRMHPILAPIIDRYSFMGGCDGVSSLKGAEVINEKPMGTMPHALIICMGDQREAFKAFDEVIPREVPRVALVDTYCDEKLEAIMACEAVPDLYGVRLDTPSSRRGNFEDIIKEVRWELDLRGYRRVKIIVSGGINYHTIPLLRAAGAEGFGVGTSISNAPTIDYAMDIVEREGTPAAKRGKFSGRKTIHHCTSCLTYTAHTSTCPSCGERMVPAHRQYLKDGRLTDALPDIHEIRSFVLSQLERLRDENP